MPPARHQYETYVRATPAQVWQAITDPAFTRQYFHGTAFEFFRDKSLNANSWANKIQNPIRPRSPFRIHQFGGSLGGPLQKDKAFFFVSYDGQRRDIPQAITPLSVSLPASVA